MSDIILERPKTKFSTTSIVILVMLVLGALIPAFRVYPALENLVLIPEEWTRYLGLNLVSHIFVHRSLEHWILSLPPLITFGVLIERRVSERRFLALTFLGAISAAMVQTLGALYFPFNEAQAEFFQENYLAGCSGVAMAYMGFYGMALIERDLDLLPMLLVSLIPAFTGWFIYVDFSFQVAFLSHLGGLTAGMLIGAFTRFQVMRAALVGSDKNDDIVKAA